MDVLQAIRDRHSHRSFHTTPVEAQALKRMVEAAAMAPSAHNSQPVRLHVTTGETRRKLGELVAHTTSHLEEYVEILGREQLEFVSRFYADLGGAPVAIGLSLPVRDKEDDRILDLLSAGAAIENMLLVTVKEGLGACNISVPRWVREELEDLLELGEERRLETIIIVGRPDGEPAAPEHRLDIAVYLD